MGPFSIDTRNRVYTGSFILVSFLSSSLFLKKCICEEELGEGAERRSDASERLLSVERRDGNEKKKKKKTMIDKLLRFLVCTCFKSLCFVASLSHLLSFCIRVSINTYLHPDYGHMSLYISFLSAFFRYFSYVPLSLNIQAASFSSWIIPSLPLPGSHLNRIVRGKDVTNGPPKRRGLQTLHREVQKLRVSCQAFPLRFQPPEYQQVRDAGQVGDGGPGWRSQDPKARQGPNLSQFHKANEKEVHKS